MAILVVLSAGLRSRGDAPAPEPGERALALRIPARFDRATFRYRVDAPEQAQVAPTR